MQTASQAPTAAATTPALIRACASRGTRCRKTTAPTALSALLAAARATSAPIPCNATNVAFRTTTVLQSAAAAVTTIALRRSSVRATRLWATTATRVPSA